MNYIIYLTSQWTLMCFLLVIRVFVKSIDTISQYQSILIRCRKIQDDSRFVYKARDDGLISQFWPNLCFKNVFIVNSFIAAVCYNITTYDFHVQFRISTLRNLSPTIYNRFSLWSHRVSTVSFRGSLEICDSYYRISPNVFEKSVK